MADQTQNHELRDEDVPEGELENHVRNKISYLENRPKILFVSSEEQAEHKSASDSVMRNVQKALNDVRQKYLDEIRETADNFEVGDGDEKEY